MSRPSRLLMVALLALPLSGAPASAAARLAPPCTNVSVSPNYAVDRTAICGIVTAHATGAERWESDFRGGASIWVTTDGGKVWKESSALISQLGATRRHDTLANLWVSPNYPNDKLIFVALNQAGLYSSADLGKTFVEVDPQARQGWFNGEQYGIGYEQLTPFVGGVPGLGEQTGGLVVPQVFFAYAGAATGVTALIDPIRKAHIPALGGAGDDFHFAVPRDFGITNTQGIVVDGIVAPTGGFTAPALFGCTATLTCAVPLAEFPANSTVQGLWLAPTYNQSKTVYAAISPSIFEDPTELVPVLKAVRSTDGGASFSTWTSVQRLIQPYIDAGAYRIGMGVAGNPHYPDRLWLYLASWGMPGDPAVPDLQLFRSDNRGNSWRRTAYRDYHGYGDADGNLPDAATDFFRGPISFLLTNNGRLYFSAYYEYRKDWWSPAVFCTTDGTHFHPGCGK